MKAALTAVTLVAAGAAYADCAPDGLDIRSGGSTIRFNVVVADTDETRARGLMFVTEMPRFDGMLFVYPQPQRATFWMKNTYIPLDMLFMDPAGRVVAIHENAVPHSTETIDGGTGIAAVLEINGGLAAKLGLKPGAEIRHPAFGQDGAAWPCSAE